MANTFAKITTVTVGSGGTSSIDFTSIPQTYTDLCVYLSSKTDQVSNGEKFYMTLNGSTSNFSYRYLNGYWNYGPGAGSGTTNYMGLTQASNYETYPFAVDTVYICGYSASIYKVITSYGTMARVTDGSVQMLLGNIWSDTSAITSLSLAPVGGGKFIQNSVATLYGIKAA